MEQQLEDQTRDDNDEIRAKIKKMQAKELPPFVKQNKEAARLLKEYEDIFRQYEEYFKEKSDEEKAQILSDDMNKKLIELYKSGHFAGNILKKKNEFHCLYEIRERAQREKEGKPPTGWEVLENIL